MSSQQERNNLSEIRPLPFGLSRFSIGETLRQVSLLFSAQSGAMVVNLLISFVLLRWMEPEEMGRLAFSLSTIILAGLFFELGIFAAGSRVLALASDKEEEHRALGALTLMAAALGVALALFVALAALPISVIFHKDVRWLLLSVAALAFFQPFQLLIELSCQGLNRIRQLAIFQLLMTTVYLLALVALGVTHHLSAKTALLAYLSALGLAAATTLWQLKPRFHQVSHYIKLTLKEARHYGLNLYFARITGTASVRLDSFVIAYFIAAAAPLGLYDRAQKLSNPISTLSRALAITRFRAFANLKRVPGRILKWNLIVLLVASVSLVVFGTLALKFLFPNYADAAPLLIPFAVYNFFAGLFQPYNTFLAARGHSAALRNIAIVVTIVSVVGLLIAVPRFGILGAAWAGAITMLLDYLLHLYYYRKSLASPESLASPVSPEL
jgi:O-antigen/teichoic acid export membrane protein